MKRPPLVVHFENAEVRHGCRPILAGISFQVTRHLWIEGDNGAGKTTLLRLLAGEIWPVERPGQRPARVYFIQGSPTASPLLARRHIRLATPLQIEILSRHGTRPSVAEVIASGKEGRTFFCHPISPALAHEVHTMAARLEIDDLLPRPISQLSTGQTQRTLLARALLGRPSLLLVDEWSLGLDARSLRLVRQILEAEAADGALLVLTSHHRAPAFELPMQRVRLRHGTLAPASRPRPQRQFPTNRPHAPQQGPVLLHLQAVAVRCGTATLLRDLCWRAHAGEVWLVVGANGAGKSTLLQLAAGWRHPWPGGHVLRLAEGMSVLAAKTRIGVLAPWLVPAFDPTTLVAEAIQSGFSGALGRPRPLPPGAEATARSLAQQWEICHWLHQPISALSLGQLRLVLLARAVVHDPPLLLLDEPFEGLDASWQERLALLLHHKLAHPKRLLVIATHHPQRLASLATHALVLEDGQIAAIGPWEEVTPQVPWRRLFGGDT